MKIALLGYGKMGKTIDQLLKDRYSSKHEVVLRTDSANAHSFSVEELSKVDVAIEFSTPATAVPNIEKCFQANVPVVVGTTGWYGKLKYVEAQAQNQALFYASNFSIGMNLFFKLNKQLAQLMREFDQYDLEIEEIHHKEKRDIPSGTAISLAEDIIWANDRKEKWVTESDGNSEEIPILSKRIEDVKGTHKIQYRSSIDNIEIIHTAHTRQGFALGAVKAAEWIQNKKGVFTMKDMLG